MANTLVQSKAGAALTATVVGPNQVLTATAAFDAPTAAGNLLVMVVYTTIRGTGCSAPSTVSLPSTPGIAWQFPTGARWFNSSPRAQGWVFPAYAWNAPSIQPSDLTTCAMSTNSSFGSNDFRLEVKLYEFSGVLNTDDPLDTVSLIPGGTNTTPSAGTLTTTAIDLIIAMFGSDPGANIAAGLGFTLGLSASAALVSQTQYQLNAPAGAINTAFSGGTEPLWQACAIAFKAAPTPPPPTPILQAAPATLSYSAIEGLSNPTPQNVSVSNGDGGTLNWTATSDQPWLTLAPLSGSNTGTIIASVNIAALVAGVYNANLTLTAAGATSSPLIIPVTLNITAAPPPPPSPSCPFTLGDADAALATRLYDLTGQFWPQSERFACIRETLRTWNALTGYWRGDFTFPVDPSSQWYDLTQVANTLRPLTVTDSELLRRMEQDLLEPATVTYPLVWTGSAQFALADLLGALSRRRDDLLGLTGCGISRSLIAAVPGRIQLPPTTAELRRVAFLPDPDFGSPSVVWQDDLWSLDAFSPGWTTDDPGVPDTYRQSTTPPRSFEVKPQPGIPASYELLTIDNGADLSTDAATTLEIPDDWTWVVKWGALADLLSRESNAKDATRSKYCEVRYRQGVALLTSAPALLGMRVNNVPLRVDGVASADRYRTGWEGEGAGTPEVALVAGLNLIAICPEPDDSNAVFTATVVRNAPLPSVSDDCITLPRDLFDILLDYAQHIASFKMGGAEFLATLPLLDRFMQAASYYNSKLAEQGEFMKPLYDLSSRDQQLSPRYADTSPEDAGG